MPCAPMTRYTLHFCFESVYVKDLQLGPFSGAFKSINTECRFRVQIFLLNDSA